MIFHGSSKGMDYILSTGVLWNPMYCCLSIIFLVIKKKSICQGQGCVMQFAGIKTKEAEIVNMGEKIA